MSRWILVALTLSACTHQADTLHTQVQQAMASRHDASPLTGHLTHDFVAVRGYAVALSPRYADRKSPSDQWKRVLVYQGVRDDLLCFGFTYGHPTDHSIDETLAAYAKAFNAIMVRIETLPSLETIRDDTPWPAHEVSDVRRVRVVEHWIDTTSVYNPDDGTTQRRTTVNASIEVCAAKPDTSRAMEYLLVTIFPNGVGSTASGPGAFFKDTLGFEDNGKDSDSVPAEFVWVIDDG